MTTATEKETRPTRKDFTQRQIDSKLRRVRRAYEKAKYDHGVTQHMVEVDADLPKGTMNHILRGRRPVTLMRTSDKVLSVIAALVEELKKDPMPGYGE